MTITILNKVSKHAVFLKINIIFTHKDEMKSNDYFEYLHTETTLTAGFVGNR